MTDQQQTTELDWSAGDTWRDLAPAFRTLPDLMTVQDIAQLFHFSVAYVRVLRDRRIELDKNGATGPNVRALPAPKPITTRAMLWAAEDIVQWGTGTGRLDPISGKVSRLHSPGRPKQQ